MRSARLTVALAIALSPNAAAGQALSPGRSQSGEAIVVTGTRLPGGKSVPMSDWRVAETSHLLVFSKGDPDRLTRIAHNLEKLHFLLTVLLNRVDKPDDTIKLSVTLIGDYADFGQLGLKNLRWQQGPYPRSFPSELYYDPREDGAVLATTQTDQKIILQQGRDLASISSLVPDPDSGGMKQSFAGVGGGVESSQVNEISFAMPAEGRLYAGFAQHYLLTYFPAAYPRWYLDGFGEIFATLAAPQEGVIEYGRAPEGVRKVTEWFSRYPLKDVLSGRYLNDKRSFPAWTPYNAWALAHLLFFSEEWKAPLHNYLAAVAGGAPPDEAAKALGDVEKLRRELAAYRGRKVPFERMTYPPEQVPAPAVRQLARSEAGYVRGKLELGARVEIPKDPGDGARKALQSRAEWLERLRQNASRYPGELEAQLLLAEGECRSGNDGLCLAAAERALAVEPKSAPALAWKGVALAQAAIAGPPAERAAKLRTARATIVRANRADTEAVLPLLAYYRSFAEAGEAPPEVAMQGVAKALDSVPSAPSSRLTLGTALAGRGEREAARRTLRPVTHGAHESPEREKARAVLEAISK
jgi:hypothetical protein